METLVVAGRRWPACGGGVLPSGAVAVQVNDNVRKDVVVVLTWLADSLQSAGRQRTALPTPDPRDASEERTT